MGKIHRNGGSLKSKIANSLKRVQLRKSQESYVREVEENEIVFCHGPAGTSKTFTACYLGLKMLSTGEIDTIILCKPLEESGKSLGYIPGGMDEKIAPWVKSYKSNIEKIIGKEESDILFEKKIISFEPLAFMRGDTFDRSLMILDEAQNAEMKSLMLFITRMGKESKCIVAGDINQYDIKENKVSLPKFMEIIEGVKGVGKHEFTEDDIVRAKILKDIVKKYDKWKYNDGK